MAVGAALFLLPNLLASPPRDSDLGRLSGSVLDNSGNPLTGATVLVIGPLGTGARALESVERLVTDANGKFRAEHLLPGWYSLRVTAPARMAALRNGVRVDAGQMSLERFVLADIFAAAASGKSAQSNVASWGEDWKWILRASATTRPILRYQQTSQVAKRTSKPPLPASQRLIGVTPGTSSRDSLARDAGMGSVLAYLRPLSQDADMLVAGSMTADGSQASSLATAIRRNMAKGDPQELSVAVHYLNLGMGILSPGADARGGLGRAQGVVLSYSHTRRLSDHLSLTVGLVADYLDAVMDAASMRPAAKVEYRVDPSTLVAVRFGATDAAQGATLLERIGALNDFPRVTLRAYRPKLENLNHAEASVSRKFGNHSRVEVAAFRDQFEDAALWVFGRPEDLGLLAGNALPNPAVDGATFNAGNYRSSGFRTVYWRDFGPHLDTAFMYAFGRELTVRPGDSAAPREGGNLRDALRADQSHTLTGKVSARLPMSKTQITTSYQWLARGRVTDLDPYGQAALQLQPFLGVQIRQPIPALAFIPAHIEALADFRNLLGEGYVPLGRSGDWLVLTPAYRSIRGGFSLQF